MRQILAGACAANSCNSKRSTSSSRKRGSRASIERVTSSYLTPAIVRHVNVCLFHPTCKFSLKRIFMQISDWCKCLLEATTVHRFRFDEITSPPAVILFRWWTGDESICHSFLKNWVSRPHFILRKCTEILVNNTGSNFSANERVRAATTPVGVWSSSKCRLEWLFASIERAPQEARLSFVHSFVVSITRDTVKRLECGAVRRRLNRARANIFAFNRQQRTPHLITHYVSVALLFFATNCFK